jgi:Xaa-Pro aminopeptidase
MESNNRLVRFARLMAGIPATNAALYHRIRFLVGDPVAYIEVDRGNCTHERTLILRDIEMERASQFARADHVHCPKEFAPEGGLSGDRETATAQAAAECLRRQGMTSVTGDRTLPLIFVELLRQAGIDVVYDADLGVLERRSKDDQELTWLREAQQMTEQAMEMACHTVARATARGDGVLLHEGEILTSERLRAMVDRFLLERGYDNPSSIIAGGPAGADCHDRGQGELRTGEPVIIDIFPQNKVTRYNGDSTRTVVHGDISDELRRMHETVVAAKDAAIHAAKAGQTGEDVHRAAIGMIQERGYSIGLPGPGDPLTYCGMTHGTGHGVGLEVHEPPLLDFNGPALVSEDVLTIEPGLYCRAIGGVRVEDMVVVRETGCENFNRLPIGLSWK